jgi:hypothetical protein
VERNEVDGAAAGVRRAIGRLIALLGDEDPVTICGAFETLVSIGAFAAEPLAKALPRAASVRHRAAIRSTIPRRRSVARTDHVAAGTTVLGRVPLGGGLDLVELPDASLCRVRQHRRGGSRLEELPPDVCPARDLFHAGSEASAPRDRWIWSFKRATLPIWKCTPASSCVTQRST